MFRIARIAAAFVLLSFMSPALGQISAISWNVDGRGSKPRDIAKQLSDFPAADVYALQEVSEAGKEMIWDLLEFQLGREMGYIASEPVNQLRTMIIYNTKNLAIIETRSIYQVESYQIKRRECIPPIACLFEDRVTKSRFYFVNIQMPDYHSDNLPMQFKALSALGAASEYPIIMAGTFDVRYGADQRGVHSAFKDFLSDKTWVWEQPRNSVEQEWADWDGDGINDKGQVISDFVFHAKLSSGWGVNTEVIVRENDFPPTRGASKHRPLRVVVERKVK